ncbi:MAG: pyridoxine 5'-phosphate synthase [Nitrospirota bacterium]|jgi:pyridoxine 5-phosphate synthase
MLLGVNIDHVATLREARKGLEPDPLHAAPLAMLGGADGITVHLREDRRHISDRDLRLLRETVPLELNLEMAATEEMAKIASGTKPDLCTLVPEKRQELTTEGGLDVLRNAGKVTETVRRLHGAGIPVSLFINPERADIDASLASGADMVEIHTGLYAGARGTERDEKLFQVLSSLRYARALGLQANAGHGLTYANVVPLARSGQLRALYIGHSIISRAVLVGLERAVREMKELISR